MKKILTILMLFITRCLFAQPHITVDIPIVKEDPKVDSLMDIVFSKSKPNYIYFLANASLRDDHIFDICQLDTKNNRINFPQPRKDHLKGVVCFNYKGYVIFVGSNNYPAMLFNKTSSHKKFTFVWDEDMFSENKNKLYQHTFEYYYGKFIDINTFEFPEKAKKTRTE